MLAKLNLLSYTWGLATPLPLRLRIPGTPLREYSHWKLLPINLPKNMVWSLCAREYTLLDNCELFVFYHFRTNKYRSTSD